MKTTEWKDTEIGRIPKDWEVKPIGEIFTFKNGLNKGKEFFGEGTPIINYTDVYHKRSLVAKDIKGKVTLSSDEIKRFEVKKGDMFFTRTSETPEEVGIASVLLEDIPSCVFSGFVLRARPINDSLFPDYCGYGFSTKQIRKDIVNNCTFTTRALTNGQVLSSIKIPLLPISEQQRIANALSDIDMLIASLDKAIEKKRLVKQGAMQQLLTGKKRLKGFTGEWKEICLGEIGKVTSAGVDKTIKENEQPVRLVNFLDVYHRDYIRSRDLHHWVTASDNKVLSCDVKKGDIFLTPSSEMPDDIGRFAVAIEDIPDACYSYHVNRLRPAIKLDLQYSAFMLNTKEYQDQITTLNEGSGKRYVISKSKFEKVKIHIPMDLREQNAIGYVLTSITSEIDSLIHEREKYLRLKDGMMQELLTGKTRLI